jgi:hypothetical protein
VQRRHAQLAGPGDPAERSSRGPRRAHRR